MSTSQKHQEFVSGPIGDKPVTALPGIGDVLGSRLEAQGYDSASKMLGKFLMLRKDEELFKIFLRDTCQANTRQQNDCTRCLKAWCDQFV